MNPARTHHAHTGDGHTADTDRGNSDLGHHLSCVVAGQHNNSDGAATLRGVVACHRLVQCVPDEAVDTVVVAAPALVACTASSHKQHRDPGAKTA